MPSERKGRSNTTMGFCYDDNGISRYVQFTYDRKLPLTLVVDDLKAILIDLTMQLSKELEKNE